MGHSDMLEKTPQLRLNTIKQVELYDFLWIIGSNEHNAI
jgi:hypothetical protein